MKNAPSFDLSLLHILKEEIALREKKSEEDQKAYEQWLRKAMPEYYGKKEVCDGVKSESNEQLMLYYIKRYIDEKINERINEIFMRAMAASLNARNSPISDDSW